MVGGSGCGGTTSAGAALGEGATRNLAVELGAEENRILISISNPDNFVSHAMFHNSIQEIGTFHFKPTSDSGEVIESTDKRRPPKGCVTVDMGVKTIDFKQMWALSKHMLLAFKKGGWKVDDPKQKKKWYDKQRQVLVFLVHNRRQGSIAAIRDHYKNKLAIADIPGGADTMYFMDQRFAVEHFFRKWAGQEDEVTVNDRLRVIELLAAEENRDRTVVFFNKFCKDRAVLDNPVSHFSLLYIII